MASSPLSVTLSTSHPLLTALAFLLLSLAFLLLLKNPSKKSRPHLPPGPRGWPLVGNLFQVVLAGKPFIQLIRDLRLIYGPIFTLQMGSRTVIVVSGADLAHEALISKGQLFANRPPENPTRIVYSCNKFTVNAALYGPVWRSLRRNMVSGMVSPSRLKEFCTVRERAMDRYVDRLRAEAEADGGRAGVWVLKNARFAVFCILLEMCFGLDLDEETIVKVDVVMKKVLTILIPRIDDYLPVLSPFFSKQWKGAMRVRQEQIDTIVPLIDRRRAVLRNGDHVSGAAAPFSYLDSLLDLKVDGRDTCPSDPELVTLTSELLNGGTDTTATAVEWAVARLVENPSMQDRIREEISAATGGNARKVGEKDTERMPYLQAFVKELLRRHPPTYFSLTHAACEPGATLGGYDIPMGATIDFYLPGISEDPGLWRDPEAFRPERFMEGGEDADMTGVSGMRMIPFGAGRRICPGLGMAMTHVTLMLARMVQEFEWEKHPSQPTVELGGKMEFTIVMNRPLLAAVRPRNK